MVVYVLTVDGKYEGVYESYEDANDALIKYGVCPRVTHDVQILEEEV